MTSQLKLTSADHIRLIGCWLAGLAVMSGAWHIEAVHAQTRSVAATSTMAKVLKRPLLRPGRIQFCLKQQDRYDGRINGRMTAATTRALRSLRDDYQIKADNVGQDWALHAVLWRACRESWLAAGGSLDRFGFPAAEQLASAQLRVEPPRKVEVQPSRKPDAAKAARIVPPDSVPALCLPADLRDILVRAHGPRSDIQLCDMPCLPKLAEMDQDDAAAYERRLGFSWCKSCFAHAGQLGLDEIIRIENAGGITLCPDPRRPLRSRTTGGGAIVADSLKGTRALFRADVRPSLTHNALAVVMSVSDYRRPLPPVPRAERDAAGIQALLVERLGFRSNRVIELKNPTLAELDGVFGRTGAVKGLLQERLKDTPGAPLFVYFSGLGAIGSDDGDAYLLPADAAAKRERTTGFLLDTLYQSAARLGAGPVTIVLEADFSSDPAGPIVSPNAPETRVSVLPRLGMRGLTVFTAAERDQHPLEDAELGMSLFTRHLIAALSGHADTAPLGNGDGTVDSSEAFVYAAQRTMFAARKAVGVLQRPLISQGKPLPVSRVGAVGK